MQKPQRGGVQRHALEMRGVLEAIITHPKGIETQTQLVRLQNLGCALGQGYLLARPAEPAAIERLLIDQTLATPA